MRFLLVFCFLLASTQVSQAAIVFSVVQRTAGPITIGQTAIFDVSIATDNVTGTINNLGGATVQLGLADPGFTGSSVAGGQFSFGTNDPLDPVAGGRTYLFTTSEFGVTALGSLGALSGSGNNRSLTTAGGFLGSIVLDTSTLGTLTGNYVMTVGAFDVIDQNFNTLTPTGGFTGANVNYSIVAVPEPTSMALVSLVGGGIGLRLWRKRRAAAQS